MQCTTLDDYMTQYGGLLGANSAAQLRPLYTPGDVRPGVLGCLKRDLKPAQADVAAAGGALLKRNKTVILSGACGVGKTCVSIATFHAHANWKPYRAIVLCPGHLCDKWRREIEATIFGAEVYVLQSWKDLIELERYVKPKGFVWVIVGRDRAKLGPKWRPAVAIRKAQYTTAVKVADGVQEVTGVGEVPVCPKCGEIVREKPKAGEQSGVVVKLDALQRNRMSCNAVLNNPDGTPIIGPDGKETRCGNQLWQYTGEIWRVAPADYIHRRMPGYFNYLVIDEAHEEASAESAQGHAAGALIASVDKVMIMTGTLINGSAESIRSLLFRSAPQTLVEEGLEWTDYMPFNERYGRIETKIVETSGSGRDNRNSKGRTTKTKTVRPGIMPTLFGNHLIGNTIFLSLQDLHEDLPPMTDFLTEVELDPQLGLAYGELERELRAACAALMRRRDKRLLGTMLSVLMGYPDHPYGWGDIGYRNNEGGFVHVCSPPDLDRSELRPKERALLDIIRGQRERGRQTWVYTEMNGQRSVEGRVVDVLQQHGFKTEVLKSSVEPIKREEWIYRHGADAEVVVSHPALVETGLDLFDKNGNHNFCSLVFYQTGYRLSRMRQAGSRAMRIGQEQPCENYYLYYSGTMQSKAMELMGRKLLASEALEGKFSTEGLVALAGDDGVEMALAKYLSERID